MLRENHDGSIEIIALGREAQEQHVDNGKQAEQRKQAKEDIIDVVKRIHFVPAYIDNLPVHQFRSKIGIIFFLHNFTFPQSMENMLYPLIFFVMRLPATSNTKLMLVLKIPTAAESA